MGFKVRNMDSENMDFIEAVLETGIKQLEAINLYKNALYEITANYEPYAGNTNSVYEKSSIKEDFFVRLNSLNFH